MNTGPDRLALLRKHPNLTGIDYIVVGESQDYLDIHFINPPQTALQNQLQQIKISIEPDPEDGEKAPKILNYGWTGPAANRILRIKFTGPGPFSRQKLTLTHGLIDPYFGSMAFTFKANCPSPFDCKTEDECEPAPGEPPVIDYLARDFDSFRQVLIDYAANRWPEWTERHEADVGMMLLELMAALGDDLAYYQDRIANEAYLHKATQPRSLRSHARLMAYEIAPPLAGSTLLDVQVDNSGDPNGSIEAGTEVWAQTQAGERIIFEIGRGLADIRANKSYSVDSARNIIQPHLWDEDQICLFAGSDEIWVKGTLKTLLPLNEELEDGTPSRTILLRTDPTTSESGVETKRLFISIIAVDETSDPLTLEAVSKLTFAAPTPYDLDLESLTVRANLLPATAGSYRSFDFIIGQKTGADPAINADQIETLRETIERQGPRDQPLHRVFLDDSELHGLAWLSADGTGAAALPEIDLASLVWNGVKLVEQDPWNWRRSLMGSISSLPDSLDYTLEDGRWAVVRTFKRSEGDITHSDYASPFGQTVRFGDGEFGLSPARGTVFRARYRVQGGAKTNVGAETIRHIEALPPNLIVTVSNPVAVTNGADAETPENARINAPEAWKAVTYRAVRPADYSEAATRLSWVDRAASRSLWTGSWQSMFATPDPKDMAELPSDRRAELENWLNRFRQTGRDLRISDPVYADLDFEITVCAEQSRERSDVASRIKKRLSSRPGGFFDPNNRSFGDGVERARLEAAIHEAGGVRAVEKIRFRRRGWFDWRDMEHRYAPEGAAEIIRVENDPNRPERGSIDLLMEGGS